MQFLAMIAVILAGGLGSRIRHLLPSGLPKCLADINGKPFIELLVNQLVQGGFDEFYFSVGYGADQIMPWIWEHSLNLKVGISLDPYQAGTGPALRQLMHEQHLSAHFFIFNGDTIMESTPDYEHMLFLHRTGYHTLSVVRRNNINTGTFIAGWNLLDALEWERGRNQRFNIEQLPINTSVRFIERSTMFYDIGTPAGLDDVRAKFK